MKETESRESREREKNYKTFVQYGNNEANEEVEYHCFVGGGNKWWGGRPNKQKQKQVNRNKRGGF